MKVNKLFMLLPLLMVSLSSCATNEVNSNDVETVKEVQSIEIVQRANQKLFTVNENIDLTGLKVKVNYNDGSNVIVGPASLDYPKTVDSTDETSIEVSYKGVTAILDDLTFKAASKYYFEAEAYEAYWSKPNNRKNDQFVVTTGDERVVHGGKYVSNLSNECFGLSFMFYADDYCDATFTLASDFRTTITNESSTPKTRKLSEVYEFHINGEKVELTENFENGEKGDFRKVRLCNTKLRSGLNTISLSHIKRNGDNGDIDFIGVTTPTNVKLTDYSVTLIEAEDMELSGNDLKTEGNNASQTTRKDYDNVGNRASGQAGWSKTTFNSPVDQKVALYINFGLCAEFNMSNWVISVNDVKVEYVDALIPFHYWPGIEWRDWNEFYVCELDLKAGDNTIKIEKTLMGNGTNMDYIKIVIAA